MTTSVSIQDDELLERIRQGPLGAQIAADKAENLRRDELTVQIDELRKEIAQQERQLPALHEAFALKQAAVLQAKQERQAAQEAINRVSGMRLQLQNRIGRLYSEIMRPTPERKMVTVEMGAGTFLYTPKEAERINAGLPASPLDAEDEAARRQFTQNRERERGLFGRLLNRPSPSVRVADSDGHGFSVRPEDVDAFLKANPGSAVLPPKGAGSAEAGA